MDSVAAQLGGRDDGQSLSVCYEPHTAQTKGIQSHVSLRNHSLGRSKNAVHLRLYDPNLCKV